MAKIRLPKLGRGLDFLTKEADKSTDGYFKLFTAESIKEHINARQIENTQNRPKRKRKSNISKPKENSKTNLEDAKIANTKGTTEAKKFTKASMRNKIAKPKQDIKALHARIAELKKQAWKNSVQEEVGKVDDAVATKIAKSAFKGKDGKQIKALGTTWIKDKKTGLPKQVRTNSLQRQNEQLNEIVANPVSNKEMSVRKQVHVNNINQYYGYDFFRFIKDAGIEKGNYDISQDWYIDPEDGKIKALTKVYFDGTRWRNLQDIEIE